VPSRTREFVLDGVASQDLLGLSLAGAFGSRFRVAAGGSRTVRQVWLDTFDWRLDRAGVTLEYLSGQGRYELALVTPDGDRIVAGTAKMTFPAPPGSLPEGQIRERLAPIAGLRALLPMVASTTRRRTMRVLGAEEKIVARITVDDALVRNPDAAALFPLAPRLTVSAVRGYEAQASRIERLLAGVDGISAATEPAFRAALTAAGRKRADDGDVGAGLTPSMPAGAAVASLLLRLLDTMEANVSGVCRDIDTEFLHDLRVAVRRTRSALKLAGEALPGDLAARFAPEFRWLGDVTTPTRDLDVHLLGFSATAARLVTAAPEDLAPLHTSLVRYRETERRRLVRALRSPRFARLTRDWRAALQEAAALHAPAGARARRGGQALAQKPIAGPAAMWIRRAYRRLARRGSAITAASPEEDLHRVRKLGKELRYLLEFFSALHEPATHSAAVKELKQLQDCLGDIQDGHVQREAIRALADRMVDERAAPAATLLAMGELAALLDASATEARADFSRRFTRFMNGGHTRRLAAAGKVAVA
jgi:CHAD domain-containing protein